MEFSSFISFFTLGVLTWILLKIFQIYTLHQDRSFPGPKPTFLLGNMLDFSIETPHYTLEKYLNKYGPNFQFWVLGIRAVMIHDPEILKVVFATKNMPKASPLYEKLGLFLGNGMVNSNGPHWKKQRSICEPAFHRGYLKSLTNKIFESGSVMVENHISKTPVDVFALFNLLTLDVITMSAFSTDYGFLKNENIEIRDKLLEITHLMNEYVAMPLYQLIFPFRYWRLKKSIDYIRTICLEMITKRRQEILTEGEVNVRSIIDALITQKDEEGASLSDIDIVDNIATFFLAGSESTAITMTWACYNICKNPEVQQKLHEEIDDLFSQFPNEIPSYDHFNNLKYTTNVIKETMRIVSPVPGLAREIPEDITIGDYQFKKGTMVITSLYLLHRLPQYFPDPEKFIPERFDPENTTERHPFSYLPFSGGPRNCIGMNFAFLELKITIALLLRNFTMELIPGQNEKVVQSLILRPKDDLKIRFVPRKV